VCSVETSKHIFEFVSQPV